MLKRCSSPGMQAQLDEAHQNAKELSRQASSVENELKQCKQDAAAQAAAAAEKLAEAKVKSACSALLNCTLGWPF